MASVCDIKGHSLSEVIRGDGEPVAVLCRSCGRHWAVTPEKRTA